MNDHAEMRQQIEDARGDLAALIKLQREWIGHDDVADDVTAESQEKFLREYVDEVDASDNMPEEDYDGTYVSDHCPDCGEPDPECVCEPGVKPGGAP